MSFPFAAHPHSERQHGLPVLAFPALVAFFGGTIVLFAMSSMMLERLGYHYETGGGFPWEKFHPGTIILGLSLTARIAASANPGHAIRSILRGEGLLAVYVAAVLVAMAHALLVSRMPFTPLVDTFLLPAIVIFLFKGFDPALKRRLALVVCALMAVNAGLALSEYLSGWRLTPFFVPVVDPAMQNMSPEAMAQMQEVEWRATALLGHPLNNAIITGSYVLCLALPGARWIAPVIRWPALALSTLSLVAFGGRTSLVLALAFLVALAVVAALRGWVDGRRPGPRSVAAIFLLVPLALSVGIAAYASGFFDRLIQRFEDDSGSTQARRVMLQMFDPLRWSDILLGPDPAVIQTTQRLLGIELGIESFWVGLVLAYGLLVALGLFCGLFLLCLRIVRARGLDAAVVLFFYFLVASTATSLSSKTTGFGIVILTLMAVLEPRARRQALATGR